MLTLVLEEDKMLRDLAVGSALVIASSFTVNAQELSISIITESGCHETAQVTMISGFVSDFNAKVVSS